MASVSVENFPPLAPGLRPQDVSRLPAVLDLVPQLLGEVARQLQLRRAGGRVNEEGEVLQSQLLQRPGLGLLPLLHVEPEGGGQLVVELDLDLFDVQRQEILLGDLQVNQDILVADDVSDVGRCSE